MSFDAEEILLCRGIVLGFLEDASVKRLFIETDGREIHAVSLHHPTCQRSDKSLISSVIALVLAICDTVFVACAEETDETFLQATAPPPASKKRGMYFVKINSVPLSNENMKETVRRESQLPFCSVLQGTKKFVIKGGPHCSDLKCYYHEVEGGTIQWLLYCAIHNLSASLGLHGSLCT